MNRMFFLLTISLLLLSACSQKTSAPPGEVVSTFLSHIKAGEYTEAYGLLLGDYPVSLYEMEHTGIFQKLSYDSILEDIQGDKAFVTVNISSLDFVKLMEDVMAEAFHMIFTDITQYELISRLESMFMKKMATYSGPIISNKVTVMLEVYDGQWKIIADNAFADAMTGGLLSFAEYAGEW